MKRVWEDLLEEEVEISVESKKKKKRKGMIFQTWKKGVFHHSLLMEMKLKWMMDEELNEELKYPNQHEVDQPVWKVMRYLEESFLVPPTKNIAVLSPSVALRSLGVPPQSLPVRSLDYLENELSPKGRQADLFLSYDRCSFLFGVVEYPSPYAFPSYLTARFVCWIELDLMMKADLDPFYEEVLLLQGQSININQFN